MKLICESYGALCELSRFEINGTDASYRDFGTKEDIAENYDDYGCGNMRFIAKPATQKILDKYNINVDEYNEVCEKLDKELSFGCCSWCS